MCDISFHPSIPNQSAVEEKSELLFEEKDKAPSLILTDLNLGGRARTLRLSAHTHITHTSHITHTLHKSKEIST